MNSQRADGTASPGRGEGGSYQEGSAVFPSTGISPEIALAICQIGQLEVAGERLQQLADNLSAFLENLDRLRVIDLQGIEPLQPTVDSEARP